MQNKSPQAQTEHDGSKTIGKWMYYAAWICFLLVLSVYFNNKLEQQKNPNSQPESYLNEGGKAEVKLIRNRAGHYMANGYINDKQVTYMLDTGATYVAVPEKVAQNLNLNYGQKSLVHTANGTATAYHTSINKLQLGKITLYNVKGSITPSMQGEHILLGMSALKRVEFSQRGNALTLKQY